MIAGKEQKQTNHKGSRQAHIKQTLQQGLFDARETLYYIYSILS